MSVKYDIQDLNGNSLIYKMGKSFPESNIRNIIVISDSGKLFRQIIGEPWETMKAKVTASKENRQAIYNARNTGGSLVLYYDEDIKLVDIMEVSTKSIKRIGDDPDDRLYDLEVEIFIIEDYTT